MVMNISIDAWWRDQFWFWCEKHGITPEYHGTTESKDMWYINDEKVLMLAKLRWL